MYDVGHDRNRAPRGTQAADRWVGDFDQTKKRRATMAQAATQMKIPMLDLRREYLHMKPAIDSAIERCLTHQKWILGPEVAELEHRIADYLGVRNCIACSSGTDALVLALRALAIQRKGKEYFNKEDEVITTSFTFTATGDAILRAGATPVFVDIDPRTYNIDPEQIEEYVKRAGGRVVGILPVHLYGRPCEMGRITEIAAKRGLFVVEDGAQAFGASWEGHKVGVMGNAGAFSFFPSKNLGGFGDGGMAAANDDRLAQLIRMLTKHGGKDKYNVEHVGYNARLDTLQAAILLAKLDHVDDFNARRSALARRYAKGLSGIDSIVLPTGDEGSRGHAYHQYTLRVRYDERDLLKEHLAARGVDSMVYYAVPLHEMAAFKDNCRVLDGLSHTVAAAGEVLSIPSEPLFSDEEIAYATGAIRAFYSGRADVAPEGEPGFAA